MSDDDDSLADLDGKIDEKQYTQVIVDDLLPCPKCNKDELVIVLSNKEETAWFGFCLEEGCEEGPSVYSQASADDVVDQWNEAVLKITEPSRESDGAA